MFNNRLQQEQGDTPMVAVKQEIIIVKEEYDETDVAPQNLDDLIDVNDPLEINEQERELFLKEDKLVKEEPEVVLMNRGGPGIVHQGYLYSKYYICKQKMKIHWRCQRYRGYQPNCRGNLITNLKCKMAKMQEEHNHPPNYVATEAAKLRCNLVGHHIRNFFRKDGTFMIPYKENAKKMLKLRNPFGIHNDTLHSWNNWKM